MKAKQKNIRVFELFIENDDEFFGYMQKNLILLKDYMLLLKGKVSDGVIEYMDSQNLCYKVVDNCNIKLQAKEVNTNIPKKIELVQYVDGTQEKKSNILIYHKPIRSGVVIDHDGDVSIFSRVNSAAKVISRGNLIVTGIIDGVVECDGAYMILKTIGEGYAIFNGDILDKDEFKDNILKIVKRGEEAPITEDFI